MKRLPTFALAILTLSVFGVAACSDGGGEPPPPEPRAFGLPCTLDEDCEGKMCLDGHCSKVCSKQADCPPAAGKYFFCGTAKDDGTVACYPKQHDDRPFATGYDCSADGKCGIGWKCLGTPGEPDRFCSPECKNDKECSPKMRCAEVREGDKAPEMRCVRRQWGHPCVIDDQCGGAIDLCITDSNGSKYCSKACEKDIASTCPQFAKCEDAGNGKLQCRHKQGYAYKADGDQCDPCSWHYEYQAGTEVVTVADAKACKTGGMCMRLSPYTNETACALPCATDTDKTCTKDEDCDSRNCVTLQSGEKRCGFCADNFGCTNATKVCVPVVQTPQGLTIGTCFK
jgi:hypothetical protein